MIYLEHFGLNEAPFSIAPNPRYLYLTHQHEEALAHLSYGLGSAGGIVLLTGEVGTGKTTISRKLLEDIPDHIDVAWIVNPRLSAVELLASFCDELSIRYDDDKSSIKTFTDRINSYLIEAHGRGRNVVLMIDEAQNLSPDVLEQLRLLTNLETSERKLLQIILLGQPELKEMLERTDLRQLAQRITARFHLLSLSKEDSREYVRHRLAIAGCNRPVFSNKAIDVIFSISHGTPRLINLLCDRALLGVYSRSETIVEPEHVRQASKEVLGEAAEAPKKGLLMPLMLAFTLIVANALLLDKVWPWLPSQTEKVEVVQTGSSQTVPVASESVRIDSVHAESDVSNKRDEADAAPVALLPFVSSSVEANRVGEYSFKSGAVELKQTKSNPPEPSSLKLNRDQSTASEHSSEVAQLQQADLLLGSDSSVSGVDASSKAVLVSVAAELKSQPLQAVEHTHSMPESEHAVAATSTETPVPAAMSANVESNTLWDVIETSGTDILAFQTLAGLWHQTIIAGDGKPCDQLADQHLICMQQRGNSWLLREYNRPAIFQIMGADGKAHFAVIRSLQNKRAIIQLGQQRWEIALGELELYWQDSLTLLWKKPTAYQQDIQPGDGGAMIPWLAEQMDHIQGKMIPAQKTNVMNPVLVERVKDFQQAEGLLADGIVGQLTLIRINERLDQGIPRLDREPLL